MGQNESTSRSPDLEQLAANMARLAAMGGLLGLNTGDNRCLECNELSAELGVCGNCKGKMCTSCRPLHKTPLHCSMSEKIRRIEKAVSDEDVKAVLERLKNERTTNDSGTSREEKINQVTAKIKDALETRKTRMLSDIRSGRTEDETLLRDVNEALKLRNVSPRLARDVLKRGIASRDMESMNRQISLVDGILTKAANRPMHAVQVFLNTSDQYLQMLQGNIGGGGSYAGMKMTKLIDGTKSCGKFTDVHDVKVCPLTGKIFVSEYVRNDEEYIRVYGPDAKYIKRFATKTDSKVNCIAVNSLGEVVVAGNGTLYIFNSDGMKLKEIETKYSCFSGIVCDKEHRIYVVAFVGGIKITNGGMSEHKGCQVCVFERNGKEIRDFGNGKLSKGICFVALDSLGRLLVSDPEEDSMFVFNKEKGDLLKIIPYNSGKTTGIVTQTAKRKGICVDAHGYILVADHCNNCIRVISPAPEYDPFTLISDPQCTLGSLWGLDATKNGNIVLADDEREELVIFGPSNTK